MTGLGFRKFIEASTKRQKISNISPNKRILYIGIDATHCIYNTLHFILKNSKFLQIDTTISRVATQCINTVPHGTIPIFIFDGQRVSIKNRQRSPLLQLLDGYKQAQFFGVESNFTIPPAFTQSIAECIRSKGFECIVAPYEADAQLAYFSMQRRIDAVLSIDTDSLLFGCDILLNKYDKETNTVLVTHSEDVMTDLDYKPNELLLLQATCSLGGCDYSNSFRGINFQKAVNILKQFGSLEQFLLNVYDWFLVSVKEKTTKKVPIIVRKLIKSATEQNLEFPDYLEKITLEIEKSVYCFHHHVVYDEKNSSFMNLNNKSISTRKFNFQPPLNCKNPHDVLKFAERLNSVTGHNPLKLIFDSQFPQSKAKAFCRESALSLSKIKNEPVKL